MTVSPIVSIIVIPKLAFVRKQIGTAGWHIWTEVSHLRTRAILRRAVSPIDVLLQLIETADHLCAGNGSNAMSNGVGSRERHA